MHCNCISGFIRNKEKIYIRRMYLSTSWNINQTCKCALNKFGNKNKIQGAEIYFAKSYITLNTSTFRKCAIIKTQRMQIKVLPMLFYVPSFCFNHFLHNVLIIINTSKLHSFTATKKVQNSCFEKPPLSLQFYCTFQNRKSTGILLCKQY